MTWSPSAAGRSTSVSVPWRRSSAPTASSISSSVATGLRQLDAQPAVAGHGDLGPHLARGVEPDRPRLLAAGDLDLGRGDEVDVVLAHGPGEVLRDGVAQRLLAGGAEADAGLEHPAGRLAGAEPGQPDLAGDLAERLVDVAVELGLVDLDRQLDLVALEGLQ